MEPEPTKWPGALFVWAWVYDHVCVCILWCAFKCVHTEAGGQPQVSRMLSTSFET